MRLKKDLILSLGTGSANALDLKFSKLRRKSGLFVSI